MTPNHYLSKSNIRKIRILSIYTHCIICPSPLKYLSLNTSSYFESLESVRLHDIEYIGIHNQVRVVRDEGYKVEI